MNEAYRNRLPLHALAALALLACGGPAESRTAEHSDSGPAAVAHPGAVLEDAGAPRSFFGRGGAGQPAHRKVGQMVRLPNGRMAWLDPVDEAL